MVDIRATHIKKMKELRTAISKTKSPYLKKDYSKAYKRLKKELIIFDNLRKSETRC